MKLWAIDYNQDDAPSGWVFEWFRTKREADKRASYLRKHAEAEKVTGIQGPKANEVPTNKAGLVAFLNKYAANGMSQ